MIKRLEKLRADKDNNSSYRLNNRVFACCYSIALNPYTPEEYFGKRVCSHCGKDFGNDFDELAVSCREKMYNLYLRFNGSLNQKGIKPCLNNLKSISATKNEKILNYLKEHNLVCDGDKFNRILTKEEWDFLIGWNCQPGYWDENFGPKSSNWFEYNRDLKVF